MVGKITRFDIIFSNPNNAFYAGQTVTGKVVVEITESMKIRGMVEKISDDLFGTCFVSFGKLFSSC